MRTNTDSSASLTIPWTDVDKARFYSVGTMMYTGLTILLHPITVVKTRQQVLSSGTSSASGNGTTSSRVGQTMVRNVSSQSSSLFLSKTIHRPSAATLATYYRGLPVVVSVAVPTRALYVAVLEESRQALQRLLSSGTGLSEATVRTVSGGVAGGIAAVTAQLCIVPMDVISQRQMVAEKHPSAGAVMRDLMSRSGWRGLYKGFDISMFSALPTGMVWWATYGGCQHLLSDLLLTSDIDNDDDDNVNGLANFINGVAVQVGSGVCAASVAAMLTQPLDVVKTRLQVGQRHVSASATYSPWAVARDLATTHGVRGFYKGLKPRVAQMAIWGTVLSSAYEYLKYISRKDDDELKWERHRGNSLQLSSSSTTLSSY